MKEAEKAAQKAGTQMDEQTRKQFEDAKANAAKAGAAGSGMMISGIVILIAGVLGIVGGILLFVNKGKPVVMAGAGLGIVGDILSIALVSATGMWVVTSILRILMYGFGGFAATKIGQQ
jgi:hypothetical protein